MLLDHRHHPLPSMFVMRGKDATGGPPFWLLEALIAAGCDSSEALTIISERRRFREAHAILSRKPGRKDETSRNDAA